MPEELSLDCFGFLRCSRTHEGTKRMERKGTREREVGRRSRTVRPPCHASRADVRHELVNVVRLVMRIAVQHRRSARVSGQQGRQCSEVAGVGVRVTVWGEPTRARAVNSTGEGGEPLRYG